MSRRELRTWRTLCVNHVLEKFRNTKFLQKINVDPVKFKVYQVDPEAFVSFLQDIFSSSVSSVLESDLIMISSIRPFSADELDIGLKQLSNLRYEDENGPITEMIKYGSAKLKNLIQ